jgi:Rrf2 family protein
MKLSRAAGYAVQALARLTANEHGGPLLPSHKLVRAEGLSERFLHRALLGLVRARALVSVRGPHGGYRLARPSKAISLLQVVEATDGPVRGVAPQAVTKGDGQLDRRLQVACEEAAEIIRRNLGRVSVADLMGRRK